MKAKIHSAAELHSPADTGTAPFPENTASAEAGLPEYLELTKPRLSFLSIITALVGYLGADAERDIMVLISLVAGTSLAAGGAAALNQLWEHKSDARMVRTRNRPIPSGTIAPGSALLFGIILSLSGIAILYAGTHPLSAILAAATIASYLFLYTPLKKVTVYNTLVGAVPGAIPPLIGWAAATGGLHSLGWMLFAILFVWQIPHFYAIAWMHREDYRKGGYRMLPDVDPGGFRTSLEALLYSVLLFGVSLVPIFSGYASWIYACGSVFTGGYLLLNAWRFFRLSDYRDSAAKKLFLSSIIYLPILLGLLILDILLLP